MNFEYNFKVAKIAVVEGADRTLIKLLKTRSMPYKLVRADPGAQDALLRFCPDVIVINADDPASSPMLAVRLSGMISVNKNRQIIIAVGEDAPNYRANIRIIKAHSDALFDALETAIRLSHFYNDTFDEPQRRVCHEKTLTLASVTEILRKLSRTKRPKQNYR